MKNHVHNTSELLLNETNDSINEYTYTNTYVKSLADKVEKPKIKRVYKNNNEYNKIEVEKYWKNFKNISTSSMLFNPIKQNNKDGVLKTEDHLYQIEIVIKH